jgi:hypothetical protein
MCTTQATSGKRIPDVRRTLRVSASGLFVSGLPGLFFCRWSQKNRRGQQAAEYMVLIAGLAAAFIAINVYARRGLQAHIRQAVDAEIGTQVASAPLSVPGVEERSTDGRTLTSGSNTRVQRDGLTSRIEYDSSVSGSGTSVSTVDQEL